MRPILGIFITLLGVAAILSSSRNVSVAQQVNSISGHVSDDQRNPLADLQVELLNDVDSVIQRTKTDSSGLFAFRRLSAGTFQVRVQPYDTTYIGQTQRVQLESIRAFEQVDFVLVPKRSTSPAGTPGIVFVQQ